MTDEWLSLGNKKKKTCFFGEEKTEKKNPLPRGILCDLFWDGCWWPTYQRFGDKVGSRRLNSHLAPVVFFSFNPGKWRPLFCCLLGGIFKRKLPFFTPKKGVVSKNSGGKLKTRTSCPFDLPHKTQQSHVAKWMGLIRHKPRNVQCTRHPRMTRNPHPGWLHQPSP